MKSDSVSPEQQDIDVIRREVGRILSDPVFARSPTLARLLTFLVEMTAKGEAVKAYTIAVDGLGRQGNEDDDSDTYARVAVTRLRKALSKYYASRPACERIYIDTGTYEVRLVSDPLVEAQEPGDEKVAKPKRNGSWSTGTWPFIKAYRWHLSICLIFVIAAIVTILSLISEPEVSWDATDLPTVAVEADNSSSGTDLEQWRTGLASNLATYLGLRVVELGRSASEFQVIVSNIDDGDAEILVRLVHIPSDRIIWSGDAQSIEGPDTRNQIAITAAKIAAPGGAISSYLRRQGFNPQSPRGCWLQFTEGVQTYNTLGDDALTTCARTWYRSQPDRPLAAFLYAWTLTDRSVLQLLKRRQDQHLDEAISILREASALNPDFAPLHIALMRAYSFGGEGALAIQAARNAIQSAGDNRLVQGMAATGLVFWNQPDGERILRQFGEDDVELAFPWEHVGHFIAAMMRDDLATAMAHQLHLQRYQTGQPLLLLLEAALARRAGNDEVAEATLKALRSDPRISITGLDTLVGNLPFAPIVKSRLLEWIEFDQSRL